MEKAKVYYSDFRTQVGTSMTEGATIGVSLTESMMLCPRKSVSAVIGLVRGENGDKELPKGCAICPKLDCPSRQSI